MPFPASFPAPFGATSTTRSTEETVRLAVVAASGLADTAVVFGDQKARVADGAYITVSVDGPRTIGGPKGETATYDSSQAVGEEIELKLVGPAEVTIKLQAFTVGVTHSTVDARALIARVQAGLQLSVRREEMRAFGLTIFDFGAVQYVPKTYGAEFEGRAMLDLRGYVVQEASARVGYIETADVTVTVSTSAGDEVQDVVVGGD